MSQSFAYASVPCEPTGNTSSGHQNMSSMDHGMSKHDMHDMQQQGFLMDCCDDECSCPLGTYSSVTLAHVMTLTPEKLASSASVLYQFSIQDTLLPSLRKPPSIG